MNKPFRVFASIITILLVVMVSSSCSMPIPDETDLTTFMYEETHGRLASPNYSIVFPQDRVNEITIIIPPENWQAMMDDMTGLYGEFGEELTGDYLFADTPMWVDATVLFNGYEWKHVAIRFKGNASLFNPWSWGVLKLPFKLDFDNFKDQYPKIDDQRFFGFEQLAFVNNYLDGTFLHEKMMTDFYRSAGVPAPQSAFFAVTIDRGNGPEYFGLYTAVEVIEDSVIRTQFEDDSGNVYEAVREGSSFSESDFSLSGFEKENNLITDNWSDLEALYSALHSPTRLTDPEQWREELEAVFDVEVFLRWLAVATITNQTDIYGGTAKNFYLYNDPSTGQLTWIPWDNDISLKWSDNEFYTLDKSTITDQWPLIRFLIDDPVYRSQYEEDVRYVISSVFDADSVIAAYEEWWTIISPYIRGNNGERPGFTFLFRPGDFETARLEIISHAYMRRDEVLSYLSSLES